MAYTGVYINLDRSTERRVAMEDQISRYGLRYERFSAADGNVLGVPTTLTPGEIGCFLSHCLLARRYLDCSTHIHVVEDDVLFASRVANIIDEIISSSMLDKYDILFLDSIVSPFTADALQFLRKARRMYNELVRRDACGNVVGVALTTRDYMAGTTSYLINARSVGKLLSVYESAIKDGVSVPIDMVIRAAGLAGALRVACAFPSITSVRTDEFNTTISDRGHGMHSLDAMSLLRRSFFLERDINQLARYAEVLLPSPDADPHSFLMGRVIGFCMTDDCQIF
jgi:GR25 family glycosyltransferase involved in LPS biosynthesis